jgi:hypothetical protein
MSHRQPITHPLEPVVSFYLPRSWWPDRLPSSPEEYWPWVVEQGRVAGPLARWTGARHAVTVRTYIELRRDGFPCELTDELRPDAIVVTHTDFLPHTGSDADSPWKRRGRLDDAMRSAFVLCYQADRPRHPYAHVHLVQNGADATHNGHSVLGRLAGLDLRYLPLWTQPGLLPRRQTRGDEFTEVVFFGIPGELDPGLADPVWHERLRRRGFNFRIADVADWHDYRDVDVVVAVRSFDYPGQLWRKPPSKLFNAWIAGVPAVLGRESAYRAERRSDLDFIEVLSRQGVEDALERLRADPELRARMIANGRERALEIDDVALTRRWRRMLEDDAIPGYEAWKASSRASKRVWIARRAVLGRLEDVAGPVLGAHRLSRQVLAHRGDWA